MPRGEEIDGKRIKRDRQERNSWLAHLILHLLRAVNWKGNITEVRGIVLIDEITHRKAIPLLRECFPNLQFIAGTQSSETAAGVEKKDIILLELQGDEIVVKQD